MSYHREIVELKKDPVLVRAVAMRLLVLHHDELTDWEHNFLGDMAEWPGPDPISTRQAEILVDLRNDLTKLSTVDGMSVSGLIQKCWPARLDLSEEDEEFIDSIRGSSALRRKGVRRLLRCARELNMIEGYVDLDAA